MTETPFGRDGTTSAASAPADTGAARAAHTSRGERPVRRRPPPRSEGLPADTLALMVLLVVILVVVLLGSAVA